MLNNGNQFLKQVSKLSVQNLRLSPETVFFFSFSSCHCWARICERSTKFKVAHLFQCISELLLSLSYVRLHGSSKRSKKKKKRFIQIVKVDSSTEDVSFFSLQTKRVKFVFR